jgi:hypothetical protein
MSGANQSFLLLTLKFLGLILEDGTPTPSFKELVENKAGEKAILSKVAHEKYGFIFNGGFEIKNATDAQLGEKFRAMGVSGSTIIKAVTFFTSLCDAAGIVLSPHLKAKRAASVTPGTTRKYKKRKPNGESDEDVVHETQPPNKNLQALLLEKFPAFNPAWPEDLQKKWFTSFEQFMASAKKSES